MHHISPDLDEPMLSKIIFRQNIWFESVSDPANLVVELRTSDPIVPDSIKS